MIEKHNCRIMSGVAARTVGVAAMRGDNNEFKFIN